MAVHRYCRAACAALLAATFAGGIAFAEPMDAPAAADPMDAPPAGARPIPKDVGVIDDTGGIPHVKQQNGISYITGGAGSDEADALNRVADQYNLKVTMAIPSGQFTSPQSLVIEDASGKTVLNIQPNGPILLAKMPAGDYVVRATAENQTLTRKVSVPASGLEAVAITWPAADEPVRAGDAPAAVRPRPGDMPIDRAPSELPPAD